MDKDMQASILGLTVQCDEPHTVGSNPYFEVLFLWQLCCFVLKKGMNNRFETDFLFDCSSFLKGFGSVLNVGGQFHEYNESNNPDDIAIATDWLIVGQDIRDALERTKAEARPTSPA